MTRGETEDRGRNFSRNHAATKEFSPQCPNHISLFCLPKHLKSNSTKNYKCPLSVYRDSLRVTSLTVLTAVKKRLKGKLRVYKVMGTFKLFPTDLQRSRNHDSCMPSFILQECTGLWNVDTASYNVETPTKLQLRLAVSTTMSLSFLNVFQFPHFHFYIFSPVNPKTNEKVDPSVRSSFLNIKELYFQPATFPSHVVHRLKPNIP